jgi:hypothetical protein
LKDELVYIRGGFAGQGFVYIWYGEIELFRAHYVGNAASNVIFDVRPEDFPVPTVDEPILQPIRVHVDDAGGDVVGDVLQMASPFRRDLFGPGRVRDIKADLSRGGALWPDSHS